MIDPTLVDQDLADRGTAARRGLAMLVALVVVGAVLVAAGRGAFSDGTDVTARLDDAGGALAPGSDVKVDGVVVGRVTSLRGGEGDVRVGLRLDGDADEALTAGTTARIMPATVFGTTYVDLVRPERPAVDRTLRAGSVIPQDRSTETVELQDALDSTERLLTAVRPAQLSATLGALAQALDGRGQTLGRTIETLDRYLARLQPKVPLLREDLRLLARNLDTLADVSPDALDAVRDTLVTSRTIVDRRRDLAAVLDTGGDLVVEAERLASDVETRFVRAVEQSAVVVSVMFERRTGFPASLLAFTRFAGKQATTFKDGPWMSTEVYVKTGDDAPYTAKDCPRYGSARGPSCGGGSAPATTRRADPDADVVGRVRDVLDALRSAARDDGVGGLLARPYLDEPGEER